MVEEILLGMMMEDPCLLGILLSILSPTNHDQYHPPSPLTPITPLPSLTKSHIKSELFLIMCPQVYCRWVITFPLTCWWLYSFIFGLRPFNCSQSSLSFDTFFMMHRTIFLRPERSCCLVFYVLSCPPDPRSLFSILVCFGPQVTILTFYY